MSQIAPDIRARARTLRGNMTPQERKLWSELREVNHMMSTNFRRQAPIGRFIADFAELGRKLVIEVDGGQHGGPQDTTRDVWFAAQGYQVMRFWNSDVSENLPGVMQGIMDALEAFELTPPPQPSPTRGEGGDPSQKAALGVARGAPPPPRGEGMGVGGERPPEIFGSGRHP